MKADDNKAMIKLWLSDALNDRQSPLRLRMDRNNLFLTSIHADRNIPIGEKVPALWNAAETAAVTFHLRNNLPWTGFPRGTPNPFQHAATWQLSYEAIQQSRRQEADQRRATGAENGTKKYMRDLPHSNKPLLQPLRLQRRHQRLLLCWWIGSIPGHTEDNICGICNNPIFGNPDDNETGARQHVSECVGRRYPVLQQTLDTAIDRLGFLADELEHRSSNDLITQLLWLMYKHEHLNYGDELLETALQALEAVSSDCLGRQF